VKDTKASHMPSVGESRLTGTAHQAPLLGSKIADLVASLDASFSMEAAAEDQLLTLVDDFVDKVVKQSMRLANHRSSKSLDVADVQMVLAKQWGIVIPGLGPLLPKKRTVATAAAVGTKRRASDGKMALASHHKVAKTTAGGEKAVA
jgi:transcription initiation factor TFIID subunit TAF12